MSASGIKEWVWAAATHTVDYHLTNKTLYVSCLFLGIRDIWKHSNGCFICSRSIVIFFFSISFANHYEYLVCGRSKKKKIFNSKEIFYWVNYNFCKIFLFIFPKKMKEKIVDMHGAINRWMIFLLTLYSFHSSLSHEFSTR